MSRLELGIEIRYMYHMLLNKHSWIKCSDIKSPLNTIPIWQMTGIIEGVTYVSHVTPACNNYGTYYMLWKSKGIRTHVM